MKLNIRIMKKIIVLFAIFIVSINYTFAISCYPNGVVLTTQDEIHYLYLYMGEVECDEIEGDLIIEGVDIVNLNDLKLIHKINGDLIIRNCPNLSDKHGLINLESVGGKFEFNNNDKEWTIMYGFGGLTSIGGDLIIIDNDNLQSLTGGGFYSVTYPGLGNVVSVGGTIKIESNASLKELDGLSEVSSISGHISVKYNDKLTSISGLSSINNGVVAIRIVENPLLASLDGLQNISSTGGGILIENNSTLSDLAGLDGIANIGWHLYIRQNSNLQSLHGLENLASIGKDLQINDNPKLINMTGLGNVETVGQHFEISSNSILNSLEALINLVSINGSLIINLNPNLLSLQGINNIDYTTITFLTLRSDNQLATCDVQSICNYLDHGGQASIIGNAIGCSSIAEIQESCLPPECAVVTSPADNEYDVPLDATIYWNSVDDATGYRITLSTTIDYQGDLVNNKDVGNNTSFVYNYYYPCKTTIYVGIVPYNEHGDQIDCSHTVFTTVGATIELAGDQEMCYGDTVQLDAYSDGGTISWSPGKFLDDSTSFSPKAFPNKNTLFVATVTDENGCTALDSVMVSILPSMTVITTGSAYVCKDGCSGKVEVLGQGDYKPYTYLWNTGDTAKVLKNLCAGTYEVTVTNTLGCTNTGIWAINEFKEIEITIDNITDDTDTTKGAISVSINNGGRVYNLEWIGKGDLNFQSFEEDIDNLDAGCYQLVVWDSLLNCAIDTNICVKDKTTGVFDLANNDYVAIYPNPSKNTVFIKTNDSSTKIESVEILGLSGKLLKSIKENTKLDIASFDSGLYFIKIYTNKGTDFKKLIITR